MRELRYAFNPLLSLTDSAHTNPSFPLPGKETLQKKAILWAARSQWKTTFSQETEPSFSKCLFSHFLSDEVNLEVCGWVSGERERGKEKKLVQVAMCTFRKSTGHTALLNIIYHFRIYTGVYIFE